MPGSFAFPPSGGPMNYENEMKPGKLTSLFFEEIMKIDSNRDFFMTSGQKHFIMEAMARKRQRRSEVKT